MSSRSRLYTRFRTPRVHQTEHTIKKMNVVILDVEIDHLIMPSSQIQMKVFNINEVNECVDYITSDIEDVYLFISNVIGNRLIPFIDDFAQITSIYIFRKDEQYLDYSNIRSKSQGTFTDINTMFKQFQDDITTLKDQYYSEQSTFKNINPESAEVLWWKFFDEVIQNIKHTNIAKEEFITFCREISPKDERLLKQIEEFDKTYKSDKAIYWYTRDTFLYRLVNQTLRIQKNFNNIFKLRLFLIDLVSGLKAAQSDSNDMIHYPLRFYRGQPMPTAEIQRLNSFVGNSILCNQFLSTTMDHEVARAYAESSSGNPSIQSALFKIDIDSFNTNSSATPFANISRYSYFESESEVLFSMHSTFLIESMQFDDDNIWQIHFRFVDNPWDKEFGEINIFSPHADQIYIRHLSKENKQFITSQLLLDMILRLDQTQFAKDEFMEFCRSKYKDEPTELKKIDDFEQNYQSEDAAK